MFGTDNTCGNTTSRGTQTFNANWQISGAASLSAFIYAPCAKVGINGGAQSSVDECNFEDSTITVDNYLDPSINTENLKPYGDCGGGDVRGVVWAETWDGSNSNQAQLVVPPDSPTLPINLPVAVISPDAFISVAYTALFVAPDSPTTPINSLAVIVCPVASISPLVVIPPEPATNEPVPPADIVLSVAVIFPDDDIAVPDDADAII